jgi:hypothetical protein
MAGPESDGLSTDEASNDLLKPPAAMLVFGAAAAILSLVLLVPGTRWAHIAGYVLGTFVAILAISLFRRADARRSTSPLYSPMPWMGRAAIAILLLGVFCGIAHVYYLAQRVGG